MRRRKNRIKHLINPNGEITEDVEEMKSMATNFYQNLYTSEGTSNMHKVLNTVPRKVTASMNEHLMVEYTNEEIKNDLFQMFPTKAPGPDGFPAHFFQRNWGVCGSDTILAVRRILSGEDSAEVINKTVLVLIPKVHDANNLFQFCPINLCNVLYKIASKVLANRLKSILPDIISKEQSTFFLGRLITDNIIAAYECLHYLEEMMRKMGFIQSWINIVIYGDAFVSLVLFNGSMESSWMNSNKLVLC
jgi:hypothetical protein